MKLPETVSQVELLWFTMSLLLIVISILAIRSVNKDRVYIYGDRRKLEVVQWCFVRHCISLSIGCIIMIVIINSMLLPQEYEWNGVIVVFSFVPALLVLKGIHDWWRKNRILRML